MKGRLQRCNYRAEPSRRPVRGAPAAPGARGAVGDDYSLRSRRPAAPGSAIAGEAGVGGEDAPERAGAMDDRPDSLEREPSPALACLESCEVRPAERV